jgi:hypothetical protein
VKANNALQVPKATALATCIEKMDAKMSNNLQALFNVAYYIAKNNKRFSTFSELLQLTAKLGAELCENNNEKNEKTFSKTTKVIGSKV